MTAPITDEALEAIRAGLDAAEPDCYLTMKRGLYERPGHLGYTGIKEHAGKWTKEEAEDCVSEGVSMVHYRDAPEFTAECFDDLARAHLQQKLREANDTVRALIARIETAEAALERISRWEKHGGETPMVYPKDIALAYFAPPVSP